MGKPTREVRRFVCREGKGEAQGKGSASAFLAELTDAGADQIFFGKGKGEGSKGGSKGKRPSGEGKRRRQYPMGPDGRMLCHDCGAGDHFKRDCPDQRGAPRTTTLLVSDGNATHSHDQPLESTGIVSSVMSRVHIHDQCT